MSTETYLNHPNFGLLFRVCMVDDGQELYATLYAQRLFFVVTHSPTEGLVFQPLGRSSARLMLESRLRTLRRAGQQADYDRLQHTYKQTFQ
ncbi:PipX family protein [Nodosilinea sp. LEGE 06152]|uniref:transcriptional coactivator PipX n=1 Tax=Nodosilinea sp. LEGE 06152 TaxID=2777966 RepID=UPI00187FAC3B|nr:PipX family protein [Nodosilinea sp. LEGE 06152]MBE9157264.1 PipX family protein [Nodosilinea sp. LEGE 06152]